MEYNVEMNRLDYEKEKEVREKRLAAYTEAVQRNMLESQWGLTLLEKYKQS